LVDRNDDTFSITRQCELLELSRSSFYYEPQINEHGLMLMNLIDMIYTKHPMYGSRRIQASLNRAGVAVGRRKVQTLMRLMGIEAIYPKPNLSKPNSEHRIYPYLLKNLVIDRPNQVWCADITYIKLMSGWLYLVAVMDWYSRYILSWELSNTLDSSFCLNSLQAALKKGSPHIFNTDQGSQFTGKLFTTELLDHGIKISMDGRGRCFDNVFIERFWRSLKYEEVYINEYQSVSDAYLGIQRYIRFYNDDRLHQSLGYRSPSELHHKSVLDENGHQGFNEIARKT
jgi:putative transposase